MANLTPQTPGAAGIAVNFVAASAGGDTLLCSGSVEPELIVKNGSGASINVTLVDVRKCSRGVAHDDVVPVAAGAEQAIPIPPYAIDPISGHVTITYSATATVTVAVKARA
jgi:hypothetical protein